MEVIEKSILIIITGLPTIKFSLYTVEESMQQLFSGQIERMNTPNTILSHTNPGTNEISSFSLNTQSVKDTTSFFLDWLEQQTCFASIKAIVHRIVHEMTPTQPEVISDELLYELTSIQFYDPYHLPKEIKLIELFKNRFPDIPQIVFFDTLFYTSMPIVARALAIPRRFTDKGIQQHGFQGLSYAYLMEELEKGAGKQTASGKLISVHDGVELGICTMKEGETVDTTKRLATASDLTPGLRNADFKATLA